PVQEFESDRARARIEGVPQAEAHLAQAQEYECGATATQPLVQSPDRRGHQAALLTAAGALCSIGRMVAGAVTFSRSHSATALSTIRIHRACCSALMSSPKARKRARAPCARLITAAPTAPVFRTTASTSATTRLRNAMMAPCISSETSSPYADPSFRATATKARRSEERRVGKESR